MLEGIQARKGRYYLLLSAFLVQVEKIMGSVKQMGLRGVCSSGADEGVARAPGVAVKSHQGQCALCTWKSYRWCSFQSSVHIWISEFPYRVLAGQELASCFAKWGVL